MNGDSIMKPIIKKIIGLYILLPGIIGFMVNGCSSSRIPTSENLPEKVVLSNFRIRLYNFNQANFNSGNYASLLVALHEHGNSSADLTQVYRSFSNLQNKILQKELDSLYKQIQIDFKNSGMTLMNKNALTGMRVRYNPYGFPIGSHNLSDITQTGADASVEFQIYLRAPDLNSFNTGPDQNEIRYRPTLNMAMKLFDKAGHLIWNDNTSVLAHSEVELLVSNAGTPMPLVRVLNEPSLIHMVSDAVNQMLGKSPKNKAISEKLASNTLQIR